MDRDMIELLDPKEWHKLDSIFESEWRACLPHPDHAVIIVEKDGDELIGFCIIETLVRTGNFWVAPNHRGNGTVRRLINFVQDRAKRSSRSFVGLADEQRYEGLFKSLGMRPVGAAFRKDFY